MKNISAIIWDFDGVLIDSEPYHIEAEFETTKRFGIPLSMDVAKQYFGLKLEDYFHDLALRYGNTVSVEEMIRAHYETLRKYYIEIFPLIPHVIDVLGRLKERFLIAVGTSREKELAMLALERFSLVRFFDVIVCGDEVKKGKPDPEIFLRAASRIGCAPDEVCVVEDAESGFRAARDAGMKLIARRGEHNADSDFSMADVVVEDLREIPPLLMKNGEEWVF
jgi:HAD superfamily hydrolase (TIGR01509 family)